MGQMVHVIVDRPIGYLHGDIYYPINYGYIPGITAGDMEPQDAYILGISRPVAEFNGRVIGAVRRLDDCEDKLVVAPDGVYFHQGEIAAAVNFVEQYFTTTIDAMLRKSCGVIPYRQNGTQKEYLILLQSNSCWSFPKGHMEAGESEYETALRELLEETGLSAALDTDLRVQLEYPLSDIARKQVVFFPGLVTGTLSIQASEITDYRWVTADQLPNYLHPDTCHVCLCVLSAH